MTLCCHESEKDGNLELEQLLFPLHSRDFYPYICQFPGFRLAKTGVLKNLILWNTLSEN